MITVLTFFGQTDSSYFNTYTPSFEGLTLDPEIVDDEGIISYHRRAKKLIDVPANVYIIDQQEILEQGYLTLVDVLENVPGIMTSQPGNALDGELFMMRGLSGNYYCKILINNLPIQPSAVGGMPIGGQLPIRQAERIEIIFGPASANYGGDAMAGVINIITKKTNKTSVIQADLTVGNNQYKQLNMFYAGRLGRVKKHIQYAIFANYSQQVTVNLDGYNDSLFNPRNYCTIQRTPLDYTKFNNFESEDSLGLKPVRRELKQESFMLGGTLEFNRFKFGYLAMNRTAHSALGQNTGVVSYADPSTLYGEKIHRISGSYEIKKTGFSSITNVSWLNYRMNNSSSQRKIISTDDMLTYEVAQLRDEAQGDMIYRNQVEKNLTKRGKSYMYAGSDDLLIEELMTFDLSFDGKNLKKHEVQFTGGFNIQYSGNLPVIDDSETPFDQPYYMFSGKRYYSNDSTISSNPLNYYNTGAFLQGFWTYNKINFLLGVRYDYHSIYKNFVNPRVAINYKFNKRLAVHTAYNTAHRTPSSFYSGFSYSLAIDNTGLIDNDLNEELKAERLQSIEAGVLYRTSSKNQVDVTMFYTTITDKVEKEISRKIEYSADQQQYARFVNNGYANRAKTNIASVKISVFTKSLVWDLLSSKVSFSANYSKEFFEEGVEGSPSTHVFNVPNYFADWHLSYRLPINDVKLSFEVNQIYSSSYYQGYIERESINDNVQVTKTEHIAPSYYLLDLGFRYVTASVRLELFAYVRNIFSQKYGGISATGSPNDIYINPQQGRRLQLGVSYRLGVGE